MAKLTALDVLRGASIKGLPQGAVWRLEAQAKILAHKMRYGEQTAINCGSAQADRIAGAIEALEGTPMEYLEMVVRNSSRTAKPRHGEALRHVLAAMQALNTSNVQFETVHYDQCAYCVLIEPCEV